MMAFVQSLPELQWPECYDSALKLSGEPWKEYERPAEFRLIELYSWIIGPGITMFMKLPR